jgi:hypothetical protein
MKLSTASDAGRNVKAFCVPSDNTKVSSATDGRGDKEGDVRMLHHKKSKARFRYFDSIIHIIPAGRRFN